jgi:hypothetical protein
MCGLTGNDLAGGGSTLDQQEVSIRPGSLTVGFAPVSLVAPLSLSKDGAVGLWCKTIGGGQGATGAEAENAHFVAIKVDSWTGNF